MSLKKLPYRGFAIVIAVMLGCVYPNLVSKVTAQPANTPSDLRLLFMGNSHTTQHNIPGLVAQLINSNRTSLESQTVSKTIGGATLEDIQGRLNDKILADGNWDVVVLQGQKISVSGKYKYSKKEAVKIAEKATKSGARVIWFAEWGWTGDESSTGRIQDVYQAIQKQVNGKTTVAPVGLAWNAFLASGNGQKLHSADGNHANRAGAFLAALVLYQVITGDDCVRLPDIKVAKVDPELQRTMKQVASSTVKQFNAMQRVLEIDSNLGLVRNHECETKSLSETIRNYVAGMRAIGMSECPNAFRQAFTGHIDAWEESIVFFDSHAQLRGEMHDLFEQIKRQGNRTKSALEQIEKQIWGTWADVETASRRIELPAS